MDDKVIKIILFYIRKLIFIIASSSCVSAVAIPRDVGHDGDVSHEGRNVEVLFVLFDAGETLGLQPVMDELAKERVSYKALVMATARKLTVARHDVLDLKADCGLSAEESQIGWARNSPISKRDLDKITACANAKVVVTGIVSKAQYQIAEWERRKSRTVLAFYDSLAPPEPKDTFHLFASAHFKTLVPSKDLEHQIRVTLHGASQSDSDTDAARTDTDDGIAMVVVGQPTLDLWADFGEKGDRATICARIPGLDRHRKTLLYAGVYGENYDRAFELFLQGIQKLPSDKFNVLVSLHPAADGALEHRLLARSVVGPSVVVLPKSVSTMEAALVSDLVISQNSSVGVQAHFMNKPVIYVDVPGSKFTNVAITHGWAKQVFSAEAFARAVESAMAMENRSGHLSDSIDKDFVEAGIPRHSATLILDVIHGHFLRKVNRNN